MKINHKSFNKIKDITKDSITIVINNQELTLPKNDLTEIIKEFNFANKISNSLAIKELLKDEKEYLFYHQELRDNVAKYLIGRNRIHPEQDYDNKKELGIDVPYMKLKSIYESFLYFNLVDSQGTVLIKSLDDLIEPELS